MPTVQLNCRIEQQLANRLKQAAIARQQTLGTLVAQAIELLLAAPSSQAPNQLATVSTEIADLLAALAKRLEALEAERPAAKPASPKQGTAPSPSQAKPPALPGGAITTAELAELLGVKRNSFNERLRRSGGAQVGLVLEEGWHCIGQTPGPNGGPARWLWQQS